MTRQQLKSIVKECLVEILSEGMGSSTQSSINEAAFKRTNLTSTPHVSAIVRQNASKTTIGTRPATNQASQSLREAIRREAGGNPVMADILQDTAANTLPTMLEGERSKVMAPTGKTERIVASHTPEDLFGEEATSKWANLAFMPGSRK